jgi:hypothetical protein
LKPNKSLAKNLTTAFGFVRIYTNIEFVISHLPTFFASGLKTKELITGDAVNEPIPTPPLEIRSGV